MLDIIHNAGLSALEAQALYYRLEALAATPTRNALRSAVFGITGLEALGALLSRAQEDETDHELRRFVGLILAVLAALAVAPQVDGPRLGSARLRASVQQERTRARAPDVSER